MLKKFIKSSFVFVLFAVLCTAYVYVKPSKTVYAESTTTVTFTAVDGTVNSKANENYDKALDGKKSGSNFTKWCYDIDQSPYIVIKASQSIVATGYVFTSGNDNADSTKGAGRNPKTWTLYGCNDYNESSKTGTWTSIDAKVDDSTMKDVNFTDYTFAMSTNRAFYQYYKFQFTAVQGASASLFQLCEIALNYSTTCLGHNYGAWDSGTQATCTADGIKGHKTCSYCNKYFDSDNTEIVDLTLPAGHNFGDWTDEVPATCSDTGTKGYKTCSRCNKNFDTNDLEIEDLTIVIDEDNHNFGNWDNGTDATCTNAGTKPHKTCSNCNKNFDSNNTEIADLTLPALEHDWQTTSSFNATCTTDSYAIQTCANCSSTQRIATGTNATGHTIDENGNCTVCYLYVPKQIGSLLVIGGQENVDYSYTTSGSSVFFKVLTSTKIRLSQVDPGTQLIGYCISVESTAGANITLAGININNSTNGSSPFSINSTTTGNVVVTLENGKVNTLIAGEDHAGLQKVGASILIIDGTGTLNATGGKWAPGIGADKYNCPGEIRFNGGIINSTGGQHGTGIGSGYWADMNHVTEMTTLIFNGGVISADASNSSDTIQSIGGFNANITINGGLITAESGYGGSAIGGRDEGEYPKVKITGGSIRTIVNPYPYGADDPYANDFGDDYLDANKTYAKNADGDNLYSLVFFNKDALPVYIDGVATNMTIHSSGYYFLYLYLTGTAHTIQAGEDLYTYTFNSETETFTQSSSATSQLTNGLVIEGDGTYPYENTDYTYDGKVLTILTSKAMKITSNGEVKNRIVIKKDVSANLTLAGVNINLSSISGESALMIEDDSTATATITLQQNTTNTLISGDYCAGIQKNGYSGTLIIKGSGTLLAQGGKNSAGIGGGDGNFATGISINGGVITAQGGDYGSGIGGGAYSTATNIKITGGSVKAVAGEGGSKLGNGYLGGMACIAKDENESNVYLLVIANQDNSSVVIDNETYDYTTHSTTDKNLYMYLTGTDHSVNIGEISSVYHYDSQFILCAPSTTIDKSETEHWYKCVYVSCTKKYSSVEHSYTQEIATETYFKTSATCTQLATYYKSCVCGAFSTASTLTFTHGALEPHDYDKTIWIQGESEHYHKCKNCDAQTDNRTHVYSYSCDIDCNACGYERSTITHDFYNGWTQSTTGSGHYHECKNCDATSVEETHRFVWIIADDNTKHIKRCQDCGYKDNTSLSAHTYEYKKNEYYHWQQCTLCKKEETNVFHKYDNNCDSICNQEGCGYDRNRTPHAEEYIYYTHGDEYHKKRCHRCNTTLLEELHDMQLCSNDYYHWEGCVCGFSTEPVMHRYENNESTTCRICNHKRLQDIENVKYSLSGYTLNGKIQDILIAPLNADSLRWDDEYCKYWEHWWIVTDLDKYFNSDYWENYVISETENAYFAPNQDYWLGVYLYPEDGFNIYSLNNTSIKVGEIEHMYLDIEYNGGSPYAYTYIKLPKLSGNSTITPITQLEFTLSGLAVGSPATGLSLQADTSNVNTNVTINVYNGDYDNAITDDTVLFDISSCWDAYIYIEAPENYSFLGFTQDMLTINNLEDNYEIVVSAGGGILEVYCSLLPILDSSHVHETCTYAIDSVTHITYCETCNKTISTGNHSYTNDNDEECNICGYVRCMYIDNIEMSLTGYELGACICDIAVSPSSTRGLRWEEPTYYQNWFVCSDMYSDDGIVMPTDNGVFITGKEYWLMVSLSTYPYNYRFKNDFSAEDITLIDIGHPEYISGSNSNKFAYFKLPALTGNDTTQKINSLEISLSNYRADEFVKDTTFVFETNKIRSIDISLLQNNGRTIDLESDEKYFSSGKYVISFEMIANTGYTLDGFALENLSFENATEEISIIVGAGGGYAYVRCTLKTLAGEHTCDFTSTYWYDDLTHYNECSYCSAKSNIANHVFDGDEDIKCNICNYVRKLYVEEIEFEIKGYEFNNFVSNMYLTTTSKGVDNTKYAVYGVSHVVTQDAQAIDGFVDEYIEDDFTTKFQRLTQYYVMVRLFPQTNYYYKDLPLSSLSLDGYKAVFYSAPTSSMWGGTGMAVFKLPYLSAEHAHSGTWIEEVPATCTQTGIKAHYECSTCHRNFDESSNEILDLTIAINPNNHRQSQWLHDTDKHWQICPDCGVKTGEDAHRSNVIVNGQKKKCEDCQTEFGKYMITSLDFTLTGYEVNKKITDITLSLPNGDCGLDFTKHSYDEDLGWEIITDINRYYNDRWWERDYFLYVVDDIDDNGLFLPNKEYYLFVRFIFDNDDYDYSLIDDRNYKINGQTGSTNNFYNNGYRIGNYFLLPKLTGTSTIKKASAVELQLSGHIENAVITDTLFTETSTTKTLSKASSVTFYKDGNKITDNTEVWNTTSRYTFDLILTAKTGLTFEGFTTNDISIEGVGNPDSIKISASGGKLFAHFRMPSLMEEHEHIYGDYIQTETQHWHECSLCYEYLHKGDHVYSNGEDATCNICDYSRTFYIEEIAFNIEGFEVDKLIRDISITATSLNNGAVWEHSGKYGEEFDYVVVISYTQNREDYVDADQIAYFLPDIEYTLSLNIYTKNINYSFANLKRNDITLNNARYRNHKVTSKGYIQELHVVFDLNKITAKSNISKAPKQTFVLTGYEKGEPINEAILSLACGDSGTKIASTKFKQNGVEVPSTSADCFDETKKFQIEVTLDITGRYSFFGFTKDDFALADGYRFSDITISTSGSRIKFIITAKSLMGEHNHVCDDWMMDKNSHWHECSLCFAYVDEEKHEYGDDDMTCITCGYKRKLELESVTLVLNGYEYANAVENTILLPIESQESIIICRYHLFALDEYVLESEEDYFVDENHTFEYNNQYYLVALIMLTTDDYIFEANPSIRLQGSGEAVKVYSLNSYDDVLIAVFKLPKLGEQKNLSGGAIAGIVVAGATVCGIGAFSIVWFVVRKKKFTDLIAVIKGVFTKK